MTRQFRPEMMELGEFASEDIYINPRSRDDVPKILRGIRSLVSNREFRNALERLLEAGFLPGSDSGQGRSGMDLWRIFVLGVLKQGLGCDFDRLLHHANEDKLVRKFLGHADFIDEYEYKRQTLVDNIRHLTPELIDKINAPAVKHGHEIAGRKPGEPLLAHGDSFVAECDVHHPTDVNLLRDAIAAALRISGQLSEARGLTIWRQWRHRTNNVLGAFSKVRKIGRAQHDDLKAQPDISEDLAGRVRASFKPMIAAGAPLEPIVDASAFVNYAEIFVDRIRRRVFPGETIPHDEKIFSVFQPTARWLSKGKAGHPAEPGVPICMPADRRGFVLQCEIMREGTDADCAVPLVEEARKKHPDLGAVGFDRGFHSPENRKRLEELLDCAALPKKGRLSEDDKARERGPQFAEMRRLQPAADRG